MISMAAKMSPMLLFSGRGH